MNEKGWSILKWVLIVLGGILSLVGGTIVDTKVKEVKFEKTLRDSVEKRVRELLPDKK